MRKVATMNVSGGEYAKVAVRLREFRTDNPRASIKTSHTINADGSVTFETYILKDKADEFSADSTGSATYSVEEMKKPKAFEKLETISVGRALSMMGYLNNGEIASSEEMEEFEHYKKRRAEEARLMAIESLESAKSLDELKSAFLSLGELMRDQEVVAAKDKRKAELDENH